MAPTDPGKPGDPHSIASELKNLDSQLSQSPTSSVHDVEAAKPPQLLNKGHTLLSWRDNP